MTRTKETGCAGLLDLLYQRECAEVSAACVAEGYPSHGATYDLLVSCLWEDDYDEWYSEALEYRSA